MPCRSFEFLSTSFNWLQLQLFWETYEFVLSYKVLSALTTRQLRMRIRRLSDFLRQTVDSVDSISSLHSLAALQGRSSTSSTQGLDSLKTWDARDHNIQQFHNSSIQVRRDFKLPRLGLSQVLESYTHLDTLKRAWLNKAHFHSVCR